MNNIDGSKIIVTGGAGFIGSFVVAELLKEDVKEVIIYDNFSRGKIKNIKDSLKDDRCYIFPLGGDIRDIDILNKAMEGADYVFHLAAMWLLHCKDYPRTAFHVNIEGTFNVLEACVKNNVKKLVYSSSASVYGDAVEIPMTENHPFNNRNFYGATKISGEAMCRAFNDRYNLNYVGLRYMNVFGPNQDQTAVYTGVIPIMLNKIDANEPPEINGDGSQAYDFIYVEDVGRFNVLAMKSDIIDEFYNVGTEIQTSVKELCDLILELKQSKLKVTYKPYSEDDARRLVKNRIGSNKKAKEDLKFEPRYTLNNGLLELIKWRENNKE
jgi:UDP-glucose 4-epimerase